MWNTLSFMSASNSETTSDATQRVVKALAEAPLLLIIETYWNTIQQQNNIWSIPFEAWTKQIMKEVC
jgi:hypothetical protein